MTHTVQTLAAFSNRVACAFRERRILSPIHLCSETQAEPLIEAFKDFRRGDWLFSGWRSSFHCLLAGMPEGELFSQILEGRSMYIMSHKRRIICSSIVGGILPLACGVAMGIRRLGGNERVFVCVGDMTASTGLFHEFSEYCRGHALPVVVVVEDNGLSTNADTNATWGKATQALDVRRYEYERIYPHVGVGETVSFF